MPIPGIDDYKEKKEKSYASWYFIAFLIGIALFYFLLGSTKLITLIIKFAIEHWMWFIVIVLILLFLISRFKKIKRKREFKRYEHSY